MELFRALGSLIEVPLPGHSRVAAALGLPDVPPPAVHGTVVEFQRYPYASVYLGPEGMMGGEARSRIVGFHRALGLESGDANAPGSGSADPRGHQDADHLSSLLSLLAQLDDWRAQRSGRPEGALLGQARTTLLWEHLLSWSGPYLTSYEHCGVAFYEAWAELLGAALDSLEGEAGFPAYLPAALREAPGLPDPRSEGGAGFAAALLAPVRSGVLVLRDDLLRLSEDLGVACRAGERRYALAGLLAQRPAGTLEWLAGHAGAWSQRVARRGPARVSGWWSARAAGTAELLSALALEVQEVQEVPVAGGAGAAASARDAAGTSKLA